MRSSAAQCYAPAVGAAAPLPMAAATDRRRCPPLPPPCHRHIVCSYYAVCQSGCPCPHPGFCYHSSLIFGSSLVAKVLTQNAYTLNLELPALLRIERPLTLSVLHGANLNLAKSNCAVSESGVRFRVSGFGSRVLIPSPKNETLLVRDPLFGGRWVFGVPIMVPHLEWDYNVLFWWRSFRSGAYTLNPKPLNLVQSPNGTCSKQVSGGSLSPHKPYPSGCIQGPLFHRYPFQFKP